MVTTDEAREWLAKMEERTVCQDCGMERPSVEVIDGDDFHAGCPTTHRIFGRRPVATTWALPSLATARRFVRTILALHDVIDGRTTPPTFAERVAHMESHRDNRWMARSAAGAVVIGDFDDLPMQAALTTLVPVRWWPLDADGRPCAWPTGGA